MRLRRASLALAVGRDLLFAILACAVLVLVSLSLQLQTTERELREHSLAGAARYVEEHLVIDAGGEARMPSPPGSSWASFGYPTLVFDRDGRVLFKRPNGFDPAVIDALSRERLPRTGQLQGAERIHFFSLTLGEQQIIGAALRSGSGAEERVIEVFKDENAPDVLLDDIVREFPWRRAHLLVPVFGLLAIVAAWIIRRRLRPIAETSATAAMIGPQTLNLRLPERDLPRDVLLIVRRINDALERLDAAAAKQREFLRRAAHHLRTPLTVLSARADSLGDSQTARQLRRDIKEMARTISQLLQLNEIEELPDDPGTVADLAAIGEAVRGELAPAAARRDVRIELATPAGPVLVSGDPNVIEVAVRNLVENAVEHSPLGATVGIGVTPDGDLEVSDAGVGIDDGQRDKIFEPFWSGDPEGARAGLGLTIVRRIAELYGGSVTVAAAPAGGSVFALRFVPARPEAGDRADAGRGIPASLARRHRHTALDGAAG